MAVTTAMSGQWGHRPLLAAGSTFVTDREYLAPDRLHELASICEQVPAYELVGDDLGAAGGLEVAELATGRGS